MEERIYTSYAEDNEITFILKDILENKEIKSIEVIGFYFGLENEIDTNYYIGKLKAEF